MTIKIGQRIDIGDSRHVELFPAGPDGWIWVFTRPDAKGEPVETFLRVSTAAISAMAVLAHAATTSRAETTIALAAGADTAVEGGAAQESL